MKFFLDRSLKVQTAGLLVLLSLLFIGQFFLLRWRFSEVNDLSLKIESTRQAQLTFQQMALLANQYANDQRIAANLQEYVDRQDHQHKILSEGGRVAENKGTIRPLSGESKETYEELTLRWNSYKENVLNLLAGPQSSVQAIRLKRRITSQWASVSGWYDTLVSDLSYELQGEKSSFTAFLLVTLLIDISSLGLAYYFFNRILLQPLKEIGHNTAHHVHTHGLARNEIGEVATQINEVIEQLKDATDFVQAIGEGNLSMNYHELDARYVAGRNKLADSLIDMQAKLKTMSEEEQKRKWANEGLTRFVDILRAAGDNISTLGDRIISTLVQYTRSNQGGLYILNDDDPDNKFLELVSLFAFDTKKHEKQRIKAGEGILGQTFLEKATVCLLEVPDDYIRIRSGLGGSKPKSLLVVPLKIDQEVYGVVELASFNEFEQHEISFVEKLGETIASTLATVKAAQRNRKLLEESKMAAEQMRAQEEEMRQNMEELQATQEEISRKERDYLAKIQDLEHKLKNQPSSAEMEKIQRSMSDLKQEYEARIQQLQSQLNARPVRGEEWKLAEEVEKALKVNLEALKITRDELNRS